MQVKRNTGILLILLATLSAACTPSSTAVVLPTATLSPSPFPSATQTATPTITPTPTRTPPSLLDPFPSSLLYPGDSPHTYLTDSCQYLHDKWNSANALPGTVVMVIMFHSITTGPVTGPDQISEVNFRYLMERLHAQGFEAITTQQLLDFMENNDYIPPRSVYLTVDDRKSRWYFDLWFHEYWIAWHWPVVNGWISTDLSSAELWQEQVDLQNEGWVDHQAHGVQHMPPMNSESSEEYIYAELQGSIDRFLEHFHQRPLAILWPGGNFAERPVEIARELGYRLGFTANPRGPLMFNWVPLADAWDPNRPLWSPEGSLNDPLLLLPRYWDTDAVIHIEEVIQTGKNAADYALSNRAVEMEYYEIVCSPAYGSIP